MRIALSVLLVSLVAGWVTPASAVSVGGPAASADAWSYIGTGTTLQQQPWGMYWGYERTASLYTAAEVAAAGGGAGIIQSLAWYIAALYGAATGPCVVYLKHTAAAVLTSVTWSEMTAGATVVYQGTPSFAAGGWWALALTAEFPYNGGDNLLVMIERNYGGDGGESDQAKDIRCTSTSPAYMSQNWQADNSPPAGNGWLSYFRPNIGLDIAALPIHDAGVDAIVAPVSDAVLAPGATPVPQATIHNWGTVTENIPVTFALAGGPTAYSQLVTESGVAPGATLTVSFPAMPALSAGYYTMSATTSLPLDANALNDQQTGAFLVMGQPVGLAPDGTLLNTPAVALDWDDLAGIQTYDVYVDNNSDFSSPEFSATGLLASGTATTALADGHYHWRVTGWNVRFGPWSAVAQFDLDATAPAAPVLAAPADGATNVSRRPTFDWDPVTLGGGRDAIGYRIQVATSPFFAGTVVDEVVTATELPCPVTLSDATDHYWRVSATDDAGNTSSWGGPNRFRTALGLAAGWHACAPLPTSGKPVKDGGWIACHPDGERALYVLRGNKTADFYAYHPGPADWWEVMAPFPTGMSNRLPYRGAVGVVDEEGGAYATKGNNTLEFYRLDDGEWLPETSVPSGPSNQRVKGGTDMVYVDRGDTSKCVYLLKGYKNEFYKYNTLSRQWTTLGIAPAAKWAAGSWLAYDGDRYIYAHQAKEHGFFRFDVTTGQWQSAPLGGMPLVGRAARSKKSKDGGSAAYGEGSIHALKGGNTQEFWKFTISGETGTWTELETMPQTPPGGLKRKRVRAGADIAYYHPDAVLYALKGNKTNELWMYTPGTFGYAAAPRQTGDGVMAPAREAGWHPSVNVTPNPFRSGFATLQCSLPNAGRATLAVYDVTGRCVLARTLVAGRGATSASLDFGSLGAGVYLVKLSGDGFAGTQKLVVER